MIDRSTDRRALWARAINQSLLLNSIIKEPALRAGTRGGCRLSNLGPGEQEVAGTIENKPKFEKEGAMHPPP